MSRIHPTAIVDPAAQIGADVEIGPWCHVGPDATLHAGVQLISSVVVDGITEIGAGSVVHPFAVLVDDADGSGISSPLAAGSGYQSFGFLAEVAKFDSLEALVETL